MEGRETIPMKVREVGEQREDKEARRDREGRGRDGESTGKEQGG
jgi:hypothetical protein